MSRAAEEPSPSGLGLNSGMARPREILFGKVRKLTHATNAGAAGLSLSLFRHGKNDDAGMRRSSQNRATVRPLVRCSSMIRDHFSRAAIDALFMHHIFARQHNAARCGPLDAHHPPWLLPRKRYG